MADQVHKEILVQGVAAWNAWRQDNPDITPDLSESNIRVKELAGINFRGADLTRAILSGADLKGANLEGADLSGADLMEADLQGAWLSGADLGSANMMGADLKKADLTGVNLENAILYRADLKDCECAANALWLQTLLNFANGLISLDRESEVFDFENIEGALIQSSYVSTRISRLSLVLSDPISAKAGNEILGALNRLYGAVANQDLPGPLIQIGIPEQPPEKGGER
ncbi:MAG: pentapeptide repeat-containing protein [Bacteroidales bacterium]|nr:pentapeptide repeat-containing protein [Candidatus Latescibacterota bacterium]